MAKKFKSLKDIYKHFPDQASCLEYIIKRRFGENPYCLRCGHNKVYVIDDGKAFKCAKCRKKSYPTTGTIFHKTRIPLRDWFAAIFLVSSEKDGVSSMSLSRYIGITQKSAWFMLHRIREALKAKKTNGFNPSGRPDTFEIDETFIGGHKDLNVRQSKLLNGSKLIQENMKGKNKAATSFSKHQIFKAYKKATERGYEYELSTKGKSLVMKVPVLGIKNKKTDKIYASVIQDTTYKSMAEKIIPMIPKGSVIYTDENKAYHNFYYFFTRYVVNHHNAFVVYYNNQRKVSTNGVESFWRHLKNGIHGTYRSVSPKHLQRYVDEFEFRKNNSRKHNFFSFIIQKCVSTEIDFDKLTEPVSSLHNYSGRGKDFPFVGAKSDKKRGRKKQDKRYKLQYKQAT